MTPGERSKFDATSVIAVILAVTLCLVLLITVIAELVFNQEIGEAAMRLLSTIGAGLLGVLGAYVGYTFKHKDDG